MKESKVVPQQDKPVRGKLITVKDGMVYMNLAKSSFHDHMDDGTIPYYQLPKGQIRIDTADLDDLLRISKVQAKP